MANVLIRALTLTSSSDFKLSFCGGCIQLILCGTMAIVVCTVRSRWYWLRNGVNLNVAWLRRWIAVGLRSRQFSIGEPLCLLTTWQPFERRSHRQAKCPLQASGSLSGNTSLSRPGSRAIAASYHYHCPFCEAYLSSTNSLKQHCEFACPVLKKVLESNRPPIRNPTKYFDGLCNVCLWPSRQTSIDQLKFFADQQPLPAGDFLQPGGQSVYFAAHLNVPSLFVPVGT